MNQSQNTSLGLSSSLSHLDSLTENGIGTERYAARTIDPRFTVALLKIHDVFPDWIVEIFDGQDPDRPRMPFICGLSIRRMGMYRFDGGYVLEALEDTGISLSPMFNVNPFANFSSNCPNEKLLAQTYVDLALIIDSESDLFDQRVKEGGYDYAYSFYNQ